MRTPIILIAAICSCIGCTRDHTSHKKNLAQEVLRVPLPKLPKPPSSCRIKQGTRLDYGIMLRVRSEAALARYAYDFSEGLPAYRKLLRAELCLEEFPSEQSRARALRKTLGRRIQGDLRSLRLSLRTSLNSQNTAEAKMTCRKILDLIGSKDTPLSMAIQKLETHLRVTETEGAL